MIGNNSCGVHSVTAGRTSDNVEALEILTYDGRLRVGSMSEGGGGKSTASSAPAAGRGEIYRRLRELAGPVRAPHPRALPPHPPPRLGRQPRRAPPRARLPRPAPSPAARGPASPFLEATVRLVPALGPRPGGPAATRTSSAPPSTAPEVLAAGPIGLEGMDRFLVDNEFTRRSYREALSRLPEDAWLMIEFGGDTLEEAADRARRFASAVAALISKTLGASEDLAGPRGRRGDDLPRSAAGRWLARLGGLGRASGAPRLLPARSEDPPRLQWLRRRLLWTLRRRLPPSTPAHRFDFTTPEGLRRYRSFLEEAADLVALHGGSLSGEHGDGQQRGELLIRMFGEELVQAFREFKAIWDPRNLMNPGKKVDPLLWTRTCALRCAWRTRRPPSAAIPGTPGALRAPPAAASASASAARKLAVV